MTGMMARLPALVLGLFATALCLLPSQTPAQAQTWPTRPVRFIIPFGPGAGADIGARLIQERLQKRWGQPVVIENRPGGDSIIAIQGMLSANDDHTFLWGPSGNFIGHPHFYQKLSYDPNDIIPIAQYSQTILAIGVPASMNFNDVADFVARAKAEQGKFNSAAVPGVTELAFDYFLKTAGVNTARVSVQEHRAVSDRSRRRPPTYRCGLIRDFAAAASGRSRRDPVADEQQARAEPAGYSERNRGGLSVAGDGRPHWSFRQQSRVPRSTRKNFRRHRRCR